MASFCFFDWLCFLPSLEQTSHLSPPRCGHGSKVAWSCSLSPPASSWPPPITTSHFFAASAERRLSGGGCNLQSWKLFIQTQLLQLLQAGQVSWGGIPGTSVGSNAPFPKHCHLRLCHCCAGAVWHHLQISEETYNNGTRLVGLEKRVCWYYLFKYEA